MARFLFYQWLWDTENFKMTVLKQLLKREVLCNLCHNYGLVLLLDEHKGIVLTLN